MKRFKFPIGYEDFHSDEMFNFTLNRWYSFGFARYEDFKKVGSLISNFDEWKNELINLGKEAEKEERLFNAFAYFRGAEFFTNKADSDKDNLYFKSMDLFYEAIKNDSYKRINIPYEDGKLNILRLFTNKKKRGTVLIHGGYDSFNEEFYSIACLLRKEGYEVIIYEGPGQGRTLHEYDLHMTHEWEKPTGKILDYFSLNNVTLIGISLGGYLATRAAAYDKRIKRVILFDVLYDLYNALFSGINPFIRPFIKISVNWNLKKIINKLEKKIRKEKGIFYEWLLDHGYYIYNVDSLFEYYKEIKKYSTKNISKKIDQDILVLAGEDDIYTKFYDKQLNALKNANSVRGRLFTKEEHASKHCQVGNMKLAMNYIINWINEKVVGYA